METPPSDGRIGDGSGTRAEKEASGTRADKGRPGPRAVAPGNRVGAIGLFATLLGGWVLIPEIPAVSSSWSSAGMALLVFGVAGALFGLHQEWRGPKRWSALLPGLVLLLFTLVISSVALVRSAAYSVEALDAVGLAIRMPRGVDPGAGTLLVHGGQEDQELMMRLANALAREGVATAVVDTGSLGPVHVQALRDRMGRDVPVGVLIFGDAGARLPQLDRFSIDFLVLASAPISETLALGPKGPALLGVYGFNDSVINPHQHGQRLMGVFAKSGRRTQGVQMFLGADHQLRRTQQAGILPSGFTTSLVDHLAQWMAAAEPDAPG